MVRDADDGSAWRQRLASLLGQAVVSVAKLDGPGHMAAHYRASLADGSVVFVKEATTEFARTVLHGEVVAYETIGHQPFMAAKIAHDEHFLVIEDLTHAYWPPPWRDGDLRYLLEVLDEITAVRPPEALRALNFEPWGGSWARIAADPSPLLRLGLCSDRWLDQALDSLAATDGCSLSGASLVHGDFRSDNLCLRDRRVTVVDWAAAARGRSDYDLTAFAIPFAVETGALPDDIAPDADPALVATLAAVLACHAPNPTVPGPVRDQLQAHLRVALPWCARLLGVRPP